MMKTNLLFPEKQLIKFRLTMNLYKECIKAMGKHVSICEKDVTEKILTQFDENFSLIWGRVDWNRIKQKRIFFN
jgi:hypothetical protein